jgi:hypothetical protein
MQPRRNGDAGDRQVGRRSAMDAAQIAQMSGAGGDKELAVRFGSRATATGQEILLQGKGRRGRRSLCSSFVLHILNISTFRQAIFLIFMIASVLKSRIIER